MIYQMKHSAIGRTTHKQGTAGAHLRYITREPACSYTLSNLIPLDRWKAKYWINQQETKKTRKNGRVCDRVMLCLPIELKPLQRVAMVHGFMQELTQGNVPYYVAFHDKGKDASNPHCHIIIRDNCLKTGKKILKLSDSYSTYKLHALWRSTLAKWGFRTEPTSQKEKQKYKRAKPKAHYYRSAKNPPIQTQKQAFNFMSP